MKRSIRIWFLVIAILVIIGIFLYVLLNNNPKKYQVCANEGEQFSSVYTEEYSEHCCIGLTEWDSGMDTRISIGEQCYETLSMSGSPVGTCINCGNGICENIENVCNCPEDCNAEDSHYASINDFCDDFVGQNTGLAGMCKEDPYDLPLCKLCEWE